MCNIAGYVGTKPAAPILIDMLRREEGWDSGYYTGMVTLHDGKLHHAKQTGDLALLLHATNAASLPGTIGLIHGRSPSGGGDKKEDALRSTKMLRSMYAAPDAKTFVTLTFSHKGQEYTVTRNPAYMRPRQRGAGMAEEKPSAELRMPDGSVIADRTVNGKLVTLLGLNREQFKQVSMIAQGEFRELLKADTDKRITLFRDLFATQNFNRLQERLSQDAREQDTICKQLRSMISDKLRTVACAETAPDSGLLNALQAGELPESETDRILSGYIEHDASREASVSKRQSTLSASIKLLAAQQEQASLRRKTMGQLHKAHELLTDLTAKAQAAAASRTAAAAQLPQAETARSAAASLESSLPAYDAYEHCDKLLKAAHEQEAASLASITTFAAAAKAQEEMISATRKEIETLQGREAEAERHAQALSDLQRQSELLDALSREYSALLDARKARSGSLTLHQQAIANHTAAQTRYQQLSSAWFAQQAGHLAKERLIPGMPCPVCGSTEHPCPATLSDASIDKKAVEAAESARDAAAREENRRSSEAAVAEANLRKCQEDFSQHLSETLDLADESCFTQITGERQAALRQQYHTIEAALHSARKDAERCRKLNASLPQQETKLEVSRSQHQEAISKAALLSARCAELQGQRQALAATLPFPTRCEAQNRLAALRSQFTQIEQAIQQADQAHRAAIEAHKAQQGRITALSETLAGLPELDESAIDEQMSALSRESAALTHETKALTVRLAVNRAARLEIASSRLKLVKEDARYAWLSELARTANGRLEGKEKIMLETYVQMACFERILIHANRRMKAMSRGQYELVRCVEAGNLRSQTGLELNVRDYTNGTERNVRSLSGGEAFLASLSLALGMSDEIQQQEGGIELDTLFVDEGFGSLDEELLRIAIATLSSLSENRRLVGIISHVGELREKIERKIIVTKSPDGSSRARLEI